MKKATVVAALAGAAISVTTSSIEAQPRPPVAGPPRCFSSRDWAGSQSKDEHSMYIRVRGRDIYRIDFVGSCPGIGWPGNHLISRIRGSDQICSAIDLDLSVSDGRGIAVPCIVSNITPLSYAEAAALPKKLLP